MEQNPEQNKEQEPVDYYVVANLIPASRRQESQIKHVLKDSSEKRVAWLDDDQFQDFFGASCDEFRAGVKWVKSHDCQRQKYAAV
eukprot:UN28328